MCETGDFNEKVQFSFQVYDFDGDGAISKKELTDMLKGKL
jgi:Ca2+-binding EF-hand superfamily protein